MGIYSKDRTMLSIDPMAEETSMPGYESAVDLYKILEETMSNDLIIFNSMLESEVSVVGLDEADSAKLDRRSASLDKLLRSIDIQMNSASAKIKSVCVGINKKANAFNEKKLAGTISKYADKFNGNKDIMTSSHFAMKYNKCAFECTDAEIASFVKDMEVAGKQLAASASKIAKDHAEEINKNRNNVFKVAGMDKYAEKFCCCCSKEDKAVSGNPFDGKIKPADLIVELKKAPKINFEKASASMTASFATISKQVNKMRADLAKNHDKVTAEDMAAAHALAAIANGLIKAYIHAMNDIYKCYAAHTKECIKVYIAAANLKAVKENNQVVYRAPISALTEADIENDEFDSYFDISDDDEATATTVEDDVVSDEVPEDECGASCGTTKVEGCKSEGCKEAAEPSKDDPEVVKEDYLADINVHHFEQDKSLIECGIEICLMAESNWVHIIESLANDEYDTYCHAIAEGKIESEALAEANASNNKLVAKTVASFQKMAEYIYGLFARVVANITNAITKYKFLTGAEAIEREKKGAENLKKESATISGIFATEDIEKSIGKAFESVASLADDIMSGADVDAIVEARKIFLGHSISEATDFRKELFNSYCDKSEAVVISDKLLDESLEKMKSFNANKIHIKSMHAGVKGLINSNIAKVKGMTASDEKAAEKCKKLHSMLGVVATATSVALSAISKDFTSSCKVVLTCYNAGGKKAKEAVNDAAILTEATAYTEETIESLFKAPVYI